VASKVLDVGPLAQSLERLPDAFAGQAKEVCSLYHLPPTSSPIERGLGSLSSQGDFANLSAFAEDCQHEDSALLFSNVFDTNGCCLGPAETSP